ncbi:MAG: TIGR04076 family protein [Candidatus Curtissbacteria bacterium]
MKKTNDKFMLYDLKVEVIEGRGKFVCNHKIGDHFELKGENLSIPAGQTFTIYALAALLPLLPVKQRETDSNDFMTTDTDVACPDPNCGAIFRIKRVRKHVFKHSDVSAVQSIPKGDIK